MVHLEPLCSCFKIILHQFLKLFKCLAYSDIDNMLIRHDNT